ncbi:MAG: helicase-related protein [Rikenellaceae bacterium]
MNNNLKNIIRQDVLVGSNLKIITAYFTLFAYNELRDELSKAESTRLIINPSKYNTDADIFETKEESALKINLDYAYIAKEFAAWLADKVSIKRIKSRKIEGKMFNSESAANNSTYITHSDFDAMGVGILDRGGRIQLNERIDNLQRSSEINKTFDTIWNNTNLVEDIKREVLSKLETIYKDKSPELLYFFTLSHLFGDFINEANDDEILKKGTGITETLIWNKLYDFQRDGVVGAINKIEKYGGCIIADSVGLGKTFEALAIIKYYELRMHKVLVLAPKKLRDNWIIYKQNDTRNPFASEKLFSYTLLNHTDLTREGGSSGDVELDYVPWGNFDLVVIDESHNFRNASVGKDKMTRYEKLMQHIIKSGVKTKVLMLSATPVNKALNDIKNQIAFISEGRDNAFATNAEIDSVANTMKNAQKAFNMWNKLPEEEQTTESLLNYLNWDYFRLLDSLTIARSRKHIEKYYGLEKIGKFPTRREPQNRCCEIDIKREFPLFADINEQIMSMSLCMYTPLIYVVPERRAYYDNLFDTLLEGKGSFKQSDREFSLKALMRTNILKRLESSIYAFDKTINSLIEGIEFIINQINNDDSEIDNFNVSGDWGDDESTFDGLTIGKAAKIRVADLDKVKYKAHLNIDLQILQAISLYAKLVTPSRDEKLEELKNIISNKIQNPLNVGNNKVLIFTAFADTATYLYDALHQWAKDKFDIYSACVTGSQDPKTNIPIKRKDFTGILINFSPRSKERAGDGSEIDILIATDCISEGQNLQDCDCLINYDIHWNPVRIIQRFGRIDRIGSKNDEIQLVNFWPTLDLDEYINLEQRVKGRMKLLDISATGEENIIEGNGEMKDLEYRRKQLEQLRTEVLDIEDLSGGVAITDLTLNDFRMDLSTFAEKNPALLDTIPTGIFAISRNESEKLQDEVKSGVIFCMKCTDGIIDRERNALSPYLLVYVTDDGDILYSEKQIKQMLDIYRSLCLGRKEPIKELVTAFNKRSNNGAKMKHWQGLCSKAIDHLKAIEDDNCGDIFSLGGLSLFGAESSDIKIMDSDYEMISYLIVM